MSRAQIAENFYQRAERIAAELRKAEQLDPYNGQKHTTAEWVMDAALEMGLQDFERRLWPAPVTRSWCPHSGSMLPGDGETIRQDGEVRP